MDVDLIEDDLPDVLALEDTEPVKLVEGEPDDAVYEDRDCGCDDEDDPDVVVEDDPDDDYERGAV